MLKVSAVIFCVLFAFMAGVIFGSNQDQLNIQKLENSTSPKKNETSGKTFKVSQTQKEIKNESSQQAQKEKTFKISKPQRAEKFFTVVLASFASKESAQKHQKEVSRRGGVDAFYFTKKISGKTWHRVGVGRFKLKTDAVNLQTELIEQRFDKGSLISEVIVNNQ